MSQQPIRGISCEVTLNGISSRADGSISLKLQTNREFSATETTALLELNRMILQMQLIPLKFEDAPMEIGGHADVKTPSQRLRAVLFVLFSHEKKTGVISQDEVFEFFYAKKVELLIDFIKKKLPENI